MRWALVEVREAEAAFDLSRVSIYIFNSYAMMLKISFFIFKLNVVQ